jgi:hypothetical protein
MKLMILASALALSAPALADDAHYEAQLTTCELMVTLDNIAEEAGDTSDLAAKRGKHADAKSLADLADSAQALADKVDRQLLSPLEREATFAYARAQLGRLKSDFDLMAYDAAGVSKKSRYLEAELAYAATLRQELKTILATPGRGRGSRDDVVSH